MKCYLCGGKIEENDFYAITHDNEYYHLSVQDCRKKKEESE